MATILSNMNTLSQKLTEESVLQAVRHILSIFEHYFQYYANTGPRSAVGNVSGYRCVSDCRSRGREFDPGPVPYFRGD